MYCYTYLVPHIYLQLWYGWVCAYYFSFVFTFSLLFLFCCFSDPFPVVFFYYLSIFLSRTLICLYFCSGYSKGSRRESVLCLSFIFQYCQQSLAFLSLQTHHSLPLSLLSHGLLSGCLYVLVNSVSW